MNKVRKRILSGMRPTGRLHIGHLLGALENWVKYQDEYDCFYMVADWHALMSEYEKPDATRQNIYDCVADWLAFGVDTSKSTVFVQSDVPEHLELYMMLSCITPLPWLERCPTYKEQLKEIKGRDLFTYAFLGYPALQAADIMLYKANIVPVGKDQLPHLELTREICRRFNHLYKTDVLIEPQAMLTKTSKLLGIDNRKMSKSYGNTIALSDEPDVIIKKTKKMITDPQRIKMDDPGHPEVCNVYSYYNVFAPEQSKEVYDWCTGAKKGCTECKSIMADVLIKRLEEGQKARKEIVRDKKTIQNILKNGAEKARDIAGKTMKEVKEAVGL
ncbi:tryptophan--tRNA ligase [PVC group bacterium]|nr:tryptophan--tRNA ligase [PVC group bacterium]